jgi:hypothetical protein
MKPLPIEASPSIDRDYSRREKATLRVPLPGLDLEPLQRSHRTKADHPMLCRRNTQMQESNLCR